MRNEADDTEEIGTTRYCRTSKEKEEVHLPPWIENRWKPKDASEKRVLSSNPLTPGFFSQLKTTPLPKPHNETWFIESIIPSCNWRVYLQLYEKNINLKKRIRERHQQRHGGESDTCEA